jgi:hypothetical protein
MRRYCLIKVVHGTSAAAACVQFDGSEVWAKLESDATATACSFLCQQRALPSTRHAAYNNVGLVGLLNPPTRRPRYRPIRGHCAASRIPNCFRVWSEFLGPVDSKVGDIFEFFGAEIPLKLSLSHFWKFGTSRARL